MSRGACAYAAPAGGRWLAWPENGGRGDAALSFETVQGAWLGRGLVGNAVCAAGCAVSGLHRVHVHLIHPMAIGRIVCFERRPAVSPIHQRTQRRAAELGHALKWTELGAHAARGACARCGLTVRIVAGEHCGLASGPVVEVPCSAVARATYRASRARPDRDGRGAPNPTRRART